ncbi:HAMP domain-containing sensor histidine kinase [Sphingomonas sp. HH69]
MQIWAIHQHLIERVSHVRAETWLLLLIYPLAFKAAHMAASPWGGAHFFSLWYPAAGVRFALLWRVGARFTPLIMIEECLVQVATGTVELHHPEFLNHLGGVARAPLAYGAMVALVRFIETKGRSELAIAPMPFGLATVLSPTLAAFVAGLWEWIWPGLSTDLSTQPFATMIAAFLIGDLLGVLLLAPALLWLFAPSDRWGLGILSGTRAVEAAVVFLAGWLLAAALAPVQPQIAVMPVLIAAIWAGIRCGRHGAWAAIILSAAIILPWSAAEQSVSTRLALHMTLAAMAIAAYLAGSFAEAQLTARQDIGRRDRMLFQAERLKTLRAMSVAIIHEISQPLSTLAIETRHLSKLADDGDWDRADMAQSIELIDRKTALIADMVRRLRSFGGRSVDEPSTISVAQLLRDCVTILEREALDKQCQIRLGPVDSQLVVMGHEIELMQILINLLRNAIAASPGTSISICVTWAKDAVAIAVENRLVQPARDPGGMGIGLMVARAIANAHGGDVVREKHSDKVRHTVQLPCEMMSHG